MNKTNDDYDYLKLSNSTTYAKIENLYTTVKEMYENGSQQSHMTLNLQFIVSQMMAVSDKAPEDFGAANLKLKKLISRDAKTFYFDFRNKGFYLIENYIGFIYCLMSLMSKSMIFSSAVYNILKNLSFLDGARLLQMRERALRHLLNDDKLEKMEFLFLSEMFQPDEESARVFQPLSFSTPQIIREGFIGLEKKVNINENIAQQFLEKLPENVEKIILKPNPFEGNFADYYNELLMKIPKEGFTKDKDLIAMNAIPSRYFIEKVNDVQLGEHPNTTFAKALGKKYTDKLKQESESKLKFSSPQSTVFSKINQKSLLNTPENICTTPNPNSQQQFYQTPTDERNLFGSPSDFSTNELKTPENITVSNKGVSLERSIFSNCQKTPMKGSKYQGNEKKACCTIDEEDSPERYIIRVPKENIPNQSKCRKYQLPRIYQKSKESPETTNIVDFSRPFEFSPTLKRKSTKKRFSKK